MEEFSIFTVSLLRRCEDSFLAALDEAKVPHGRVTTFGHFSQATPITEVISMPAHSMPWNVISAVIFTWLKQCKSREVMITTEDGEKIPASGKTVIDLKELLTKAVGIYVMETYTKPTAKINQLSPSQPVWN